MNNHAGKFTCPRCRHPPWFALFSRRTEQRESASGAELSGAVDLPDVVSPRQRHVGTTVSQADPVRPPDGWPGFLPGRSPPV
jgi:hypothetical protein